LKAEQGQNPLDQRQQEGTIIANVPNGSKADAHLGSVHGYWAQEAARPLTIEEIASAPFPSHLKASRANGSVAWIYNDRGARNVWIAERSGSGYKTRGLTANTGDMGVDLVDLGWTGNGNWLLYVQGGDDGGRTPVNPMGLASGPRAGEVRAVSTEGIVLRIGPGTAPVPSPVGDRLIFTRDGQPFLAFASGGEPVPLFRDPGSVTGVAWAPDGQRFAFVSERGTHSLVGVFELGGQAPVWLNPSAAKDQEPVWSPDGRRVAFLRLPSDHGPRNAFFSDREGRPWEIWAADAAGGDGRRLWTASAGVGSRFRKLFNSDKSLFWAAGDQLVFPWEGTGWVRLYALSLEGGTRLLTPGQSEVFAAELSVDRQRIVYAANDGDLDRRHLYEVALAGGSPRQITVSEGIEDMPAIAADERIFALRSGPTSPLRPAVVTSEGMVDLAPDAVPPHFPAERLVAPQLVAFPAPDGTIVRGQIFVPSTLRGGRAPALVFFHGGPTDRQTFAAWDSFEVHAYLYQANQYLAARGYIVLSVNYRGGAGYGYEHRTAPDLGAGGAGELQDIVAAADYLRSRPDVDPERLGVWGGSYGGWMVSLALASAPQYWAAGVAIAGAHDWTRMPQMKNPMHSDDFDIAYASSAIARLEGWRAPILLIHGDTDRDVPIEQTKLLAAALRKRSIPVEELVIPNEVHFLLRHASWNRVFNATADFFDRRIGS
jgi:dipeptidyl aminopeptidase/acylaminoacyl peptidase